MKTASFLNNITFNNTKPAINMLLETSFSKEIRIAFKEGQVMTAHKAPLAIVVQVLKGAIDFGVYDEIIPLKSGDLISLEPNVIHHLSAIKESVVRLTLLKLDNIERLEKVLK
ncbi:AraC family ligand binding domain-containing protein [Polaribacter tangerinus]|uniref:AraC family ligand binding domain-containing protein n=1 Tax=Polaribacter tangerinus TaxID=1920034 RepID=UPI000B4BD758|nr:AraC family ligand binding domain-containing protein [Polaribacter tangerinus]